MVSLVQISDPHFGTEQPPVVEALVRMVRAQSPDLLVLSGDITQRAHRSQFRAARAFVERLGVPATLAIPGNHDIKLLNVASRLFTPYANYCREFGDDLEPVFDAPQLLVVGVNTTRNYRHARGAVSGAQIERVADRLSRATEQQLRVVVTHQPVCVTLPRDEPDQLLGHARAVRRWAEAGADLILGGHIHLPFVQPLRTHHAGLPRHVWAVQAGTAVSDRVIREAGNSVNLIRYAGALPRRACVVERWDFNAAQQSFAPIAQEELLLDGAGGGA